MSTLKARMPGNPTVRIRAARMSDLDALVELENRSFTSDRMSRRQWRHHLANASACVLVAQADQPMAGAAIVFFRKNSTISELGKGAYFEFWMPELNRATPDAGPAL